MSAGKLLFFATEDWFVRSHFLPLLKRARADGYEVVVAARDSGALVGEDVRVIDTPFARGSIKPWDLARQVAHLRELLARERPEVVHAIALKPLALLALAGYRSGGRVFALTGRGYLGVRRSAWTQTVNEALKTALRAALGEDRSLLLAENTDDRDWLSRDGDLDAKTLIMPGAGVDPDAFARSQQPASSPIVVGVVTRLIWTKGLDLLVDAVQRLRAQGEDIVLRIAGDPDVESPEAAPTEEIESWRRLGGVELLGRVNDVNAFWVTAHIACLASRGGEGLPRSLLEAAACARPAVTTDVPGCRDFVTPDIGIVVPRDDVDSLAEALRLLARDASLRAAMGEAGRAKVVAGYTEAHAAEVASRAWAAVRT